MIRPRLLLLLLALGGAGCASPAGWDGIAPKVIGAPLLTYVDGDPEAGTTTLLSLPLLTYRGTKQKPGYHQGKTCFTPLLAHYERTTREIRVVRKDDAPRCPEDDPLAPDGGPRPSPPPARDEELSSREKAQRGISLSRPGREPNNRKARSRSEAKREPRTRRERDERAEPKRAKKGPKRSSYRRLARKTDDEWKGYTLALKQSGEVLDHVYPATKTDLNVLWPLVRLASERPGRVGFRPDVGAPKVYEVGRDTTEVRVLPLFSYERKGSFVKTILWPLLGFGWETTKKGTYLRLFYFLRFKLD